MTKELGQRVARLRSYWGLNYRELGASTGITFSELWKLENGKKRRASSRLVDRLAAFFHTTTDYLQHGTPPETEAVLQGFWRYYREVPGEEREALKLAPICDRVAAVLRYLDRTYPDALGSGAVAAACGLTAAELSQLLEGRQPVTTLLLRTAARFSGLPLEFFTRGDFFGGASIAAPAAATDDPQAMSQYFDVVREAIVNGVSPGMLQKAIHILAAAGAGGLRKSEERQEPGSQGSTRAG